MKLMPKIAGLQQRGKTWFVRVRVPKDVQSHFKGKEIIRSLETRNYDEASKRIHAVRAGIEAEFEKLRKVAKAKVADTDMLSGYSEHELTALTLQWFKDIKAKEEKRRMQSTSKWTEEEKRTYHIELQQAAQVAREEVVGMEQADRNDGLTMAARFLKTEGVSFSKQSENFYKLGHFFSKAINELAHQRLRELEGKIHVPSDPMFSVSTRHDVPHLGKAISIGAVVKEFLADPKLRRSELALKNYRVIGRAIDEIVGNNTPVHQVTREHCKTISTLLLALPANALKKTKAKTLKKAVEIGETKNLPKLSDSTYNTYMQKLNALMEYAVQETYITANPAKKLYVPSVMQDKERRDPFTIEQLQKIFSHEDYCSLRKHARIYKPSSKKQMVYAHYWIPQISLWSAMRLNEICQLYVTDIAKIDNVYAIIIRKEIAESVDGKTDKKVKTKSGTRTLPIHPKLIEAGFLKYVDSVREAGKARVFPDLVLDARGYYSHEYSKWFTRYLKKINAKTDRTSFHSFRHSYRDAIRRAKLSRDATLQLGGWNSKATDDNYGSGLGVRDLYQEACTIDYKDLDLSHLYK